MKLKRKYIAGQYFTCNKQMTGIKGIILKNPHIVIEEYPVSKKHETGY
jgi:hypothetical protein